MKRHSLFFLLLIAFMLIGTSRVMGQNKSAVAPADLKRYLADVFLCIRRSEYSRRVKAE